MATSNLFGATYRLFLATERLFGGGLAGKACLFLKPPEGGCKFFVSFVLQRPINTVVYGLSESVSGKVSDGSRDSCESALETILYLESSQAPKSISLHRLEQKGKNVACLHCS